MKKLILLAAGLPLCFGYTAAQSKYSHTSTVSMSDNSASDDCSEHLRVYNDDFRTTVRDEENISVPNQALTITAEHNGGIRVTTWDKPDFSLKLCKQVSVDDDAEGRKLLAETRLKVEGGKVSISAPESDDHHSLGTLLLVKAPRDAKLDLSVYNGGVSLTNFTGTATAHAHNGGIALRGSTGKLSLEAQNGGISIKDCGGDIDATVQNGGISLSLPEHWEGKGLEAHTHNGGLVVVVPKNMSSGVEVSGSNHTSIICKGDVCDGAERTWDSDRRILRFGGPNPQIRATTVNGGIVVEARGHQRGEL
ncbi:MAG TPA: hypothetical protein VKE93_00725 [Candidatus Angelobacter sp.]|nr:hypothetical protein [Candidatus Angelobacter sp.]